MLFLMDNSLLQRQHERRPNMHKARMAALGIGVLILGLMAALAPQAWADAPEQQGKVYLGIVGAPASGAEQAGVRVHQVEPNSPAAKAGLKPGDLITKMGDLEIRDWN